MKFKLYIVTILLSICAGHTASAHTASAESVTAINDGSWSVGSTWSSGQAPQNGDDVVIPAGRKVIYDVQPDYPIHSLLIKGKLEFSRSNDTKLSVGMVVITNNEDTHVSHGCGHGGHGLSGDASLEVGSAASPIPAGITATIRLVEYADQDNDCAPGIINYARMDVHGAPLNHTWVKLETTAPSGSNQVQLREAVSWNVGDKIIVSGTNRRPEGRSPGTVWSDHVVPRTEERVITSISGDNRTLTLNQNLVYTHDVHLAIPQNIVHGASDRRGEVAVLTRNVVIESADPEGVRGHTMYHRGAFGSLSYAEFRHLGKAGLVGRYPVHFHIAKDSMRGSYIDGISVWDSKNRWITIHATEYMVIKNTVAYDALGHGYFLEDGSETLNYLGDNLGVLTTMTDPLPGQVLAYDANAGACYWAANARNFIINNTYAECDNDDSFILDYDFQRGGDNEGLPTIAATPVLNSDGTRSENVDVRFMSGGLVKGLEVHTHWGWGPWIRGADYPETDPLVFEDSKVWDVNYSYDISGSNVVFDGAEIYDAPYGFYNLYPGSHVVRDAYCEDVRGHGCFMTYRGGDGLMIYENIKTYNSRMVFRITARNEEGAEHDPIQIHARNATILDPDTDFPNAAGKPSWAGTESDNVRTNPLLMLTIHDVFGPNQDGVVLPEVQSSTQPGVPAGLVFTDGLTTTDANSSPFEGRGEMKVASADVAFPSSPLLQPAIDTLPPATIVLSPQPGTTTPISNGVLLVKGVSLDAHTLEKVTVNGVEASISGNGIDWSVFLSGISPGAFTVEAFAEDLAGNVEVMRHSVDVEISVAGTESTVPNPPTGLGVS